MSSYEFNVETKEALIYDRYPRPADHVCKHIVLTTHTVSLTSHHRRMVRERHANHFKRKSSIPIQILKSHHLSRSSLLLFFFYLNFFALRSSSSFSSTSSSSSSSSSQQKLYLRVAHCSEHIAQNLMSFIKAPVPCFCLNCLSADTYDSSGYSLCRVAA